MSVRKHPLLAVVTVAATFVTMATGSGPSAMAAQPDIDSTWHSGAAFPLDVQGYGTPVAQVVDTDGSTFVAGIGYPHQFPVALVTKLDPSGNLDPSFGGGTVDLTGLEFGQTRLRLVSGAAIQPGLGLVVAGQVGNDWRVVRLTQTGAVDPTFGTAGVVELLDTSAGTFLLSGAPSLAVAPDGKIVLAGFVTNAAQANGIGVVRLNADGSIDQTFGTDGATRAPQIRPSNEIQHPSLGVDKRGRIVLSVAQSFNRPTLIRMTAAGTPDVSFGVGGLLERPRLVNRFQTCSADFTFDPDGLILSACPAGEVPNSAGISRYLDNGTLDESFGAGGTAYAADSVTGQRGSLGQVITLDDHAIILAGATWDSDGQPASRDYAIWRFSASGHLDRRFGSTPGVIRGHIGASDDFVGIDALPDGRLIATIDTNRPEIYFDTHAVVTRFRPIRSAAPSPMTLLASPTRLLDTRLGVPNGAARTSAGSIVSLTVGGVAGIPADAAAVIMNLTVTEPAADGYATVYPCGQPPPTASNVNFVAGQTIPNLVISRVGANRGVCIFTSEATHLIADVTASYGPNPDLHAVPAPLRLVDTRNSIGWSTRRKIGPGRPFSPAIQRSQIPNSEWTSEALLNVTIADADASGYLTVFPCGQPVPTASNLNFRAHQTISNFVAVRLPPLGPAGIEAAICFQTTASAHLIVDLEATVDIGATEVTTPTPTRLLDTRTGFGSATGHLAGWTIMELQVSGRAGVPQSAGAVGMNVTVTEASAGGFLTVYPCDHPVPTASNLNFVAGDTIPNYVIARLDARGKACFISSVPTHVIADVATYYDNGLIDH